MTDRKATTRWEGDLPSGKGRVHLDSSNLGEFDVSWPARTEGPEGQTSPEELLAAAHSACFSMAISKQIENRGATPGTVETSVVYSFEKGDAGFSITRAAITVKAEAQGLDDAALQEAATAAKDGCPVSRAVAGNVTVTVEASLA